MTARERITLRHAAPNPLPYSPAIRYGEFVFVAGQVSQDLRTGEIVPGDIRVQTRRVLENIQTILESAGTSLDNCLEALCFLADRADFQAFNEVYARYFPEPRPARTTVQATLLRPDLKVEIRVVAAIPVRTEA